MDLVSFRIIVSPCAHLFIISEATTDFSGTIRVEFFVAPML